MTHQIPSPAQSSARTADTDRILRMFARFTSVLRDVAQDLPGHTKAR